MSHVLRSTCLWLAAAAIASGCSSSKVSSPPRSVPAVAERPPHLLAAPHAVCVRNTRVVLAVLPGWALDVSSLSSGLLPTGRRVPVRVVQAHPERAAAMPGWLPDNGPWATHPFAASKPERAGIPLVVFDPFDGEPTEVVLGGTRVQLHWVDVATPAPPRAEPSADAGATAALHAMLASEAACPMTRWRARLVGADAPALMDPALETWAIQQEAAVSEGLRKLDQADAAVARAFKQRLVSVAQFPGGVRAPLWPVVDESLLELFTALAIESTSPAQAALLARDFLATLPPGAAWVRDDAAGVGARTSEGAAAILAAVDAVDLLDKPTLGTFTAADSPSLLRLEPGVVAERLLAFPTGQDAQAVLPLLTFGMSQWQVQQRVAAIPIPVQPPGLAIGPLVPDWTMTELAASSEASLLQRTRSDIRVTLTFRAEAIAGSGPDDPSGWTLLMASAEPRCSQELLAVYLGTRAEPTGLVVVGPDGANRSSGFGAAAQLKVARLASGWACEIILPRGVIDARGRLWIGLTFQDALRGRLSWPRPQLPWQPEPGRVVVDTNTWGMLESPLRGRPTDAPR